MLREHIQVPRGEYVPDADHRVVMQGLDWDRFEQLLSIRGERSQPRMAYLDGAIELMTTSRTHETIKSLLRVLLEIYLLDRNIPYLCVGSWTVKHRADEAGFEADESYFVPYDPSRPAPDRPDLAIEIVWTSGGLDKLEIYRRLGVGEVWFWIDGAITVHVLREGGYETRTESACLPEVDLALIARLLEQPTPNLAVGMLRDALAGQSPP